MNEHTQPVRDIEALYQHMRDFTSHLNDWDGEDMQNSVATDMLAHLTPEARAQLVFQFLTEGNATFYTDGEPQVNREGKQFAIDLAEVMGPDWAQWLYNFAKVVTKLA